jgi:hypothetical protein
VAEPDRILHRVPDRRGPASHRQLTIFVRRIVVLASVVLGLLLLGAAGLSISEGEASGTAFRWALDTGATVGGFPQPHSTGGGGSMIVGLRREGEFQPQPPSDTQLRSGD